MILALIQETVTELSHSRVDKLQNFIYNNVTFLNKGLMTVTTNERGHINMFAKEPPMQVMDVSVTHNEKAELLNGRLAMLGLLAAVISYVSTGSIFFFGAFGI